MTKGKNTEPRKIDQWNLNDLKFFDNWTKNLLLASPVQLERFSLWRLTKPSKLPVLTQRLEFILGEFEDEAKKKLEENGLDSEELIKRWRTLFDPKKCGPLDRFGIPLSLRRIEDEYPSLSEPFQTSIQLQNAAHVALCADRVRTDISNGDTEQTAIDTVKFCFTVFSANLHEIIIRGIRAKWGPTKPRPSSGKKWVLSLLEYARTNLKIKTFSELMIYLRAHYQGKEKALKINKRKVYLSLTRKGDYRLNCGRENIGSEAFRKRFQALKKLGS